MSSKNRDGGGIFVLLLLVAAVIYLYSLKGG